MKNLLNQIPALFCIILAVGLLVSCEEDDNEKEWGFAKVYMPQAAIKDGGITNDYPVPFNNSTVKNYELDEAKGLLQVYLGVYRSGLQKLESFSVDVSADINATHTAVENIEGGVVLPQGLYSIPEKVTVPAGEREAEFMLTVDIDKIKEDYPGFGIKKIVLVVGISNPDKYEMNNELAKTTVIINGSTFLPRPPTPELVDGADFSDYTDLSEKWTLVNQLSLTGSNPATFREDMAVVDNGRMKITFGDTDIRAGIAVYQQLELEKGKEYEFTSGITTTGPNGSCQFLSCFSTSEPSPSNPAHNYYNKNNNIFAWMGTWATNGAGNVFVPMTNAVYPTIENIYTNMDPTTGRFASPFETGPVYLIFFLSCSGPGNPGTIWLDNISVKEVIQ